MLPDDITDQGETVAVAHIGKNVNENIPGANRAQKGQLSITSERIEMQVSASVVPNQSFGHGTEEKPKPRPLQTKGSGTPKSQASHSALTYRSGIIQS